MFVFSSSHQSKPDSGFALILALIIASVALSIGLSLLNITVKQLTLSSTALQSEVAFRVADAAMECLSLARYNLVVDGVDPIEIIDYNNAVVEDVSCLGETLSFSLPDAGVGTNSDAKVFHNGPFNWSDAGGSYCFDTSLYVYEDGDEIDIRSVNKQCTGAACYVGVARGYNRSCADVANGAVFAVEREITADF